MTEQEIERCLERLATCKTTDVMNFDYAGTLAYIKRLKSENVALRNEADENAALSMENKMRADRLEKETAALRARLERSVELPVKIGDTVYKVYDKCDGHNCPYNGDYGQWRCHYEGERRCKPFIIIKQFCYSDIPFVNKTIFVLREAAEARLAELKGEKNE